MTEKLRFITGVLVLPQRNPVLAKEIATLDHLTGRVSLGIGVGWLAEGFDAIGVPSLARQACGRIRCGDAHSLGRR